MTSLEFEKRGRFPDDTPMKKHKDSSSNKIIELQIPQDIGQRLSRLFPHKAHSEIEDVIRATSGNFDQCLLELQKQNLDINIREKIAEYARGMVEELVRADTMDTAERLIQESLKQFFKEMQETAHEHLQSENNLLKEQIKTLLNDAAVLKKAVLKLHRRMEQDQEIQLLNEELRKERLKVYALQMQLAEVYRFRSINPSNELF